jgi:hypothetical protein
MPEALPFGKPPRRPVGGEFDFPSPEFRKNGGKGYFCNKFLTVSFDNE